MSSLEDTLTANRLTLAPGVRVMPHTISKNADGSYTYNIKRKQLNSMAMDAATTSPSVSFPVQFFNFVDPNIIEVLFSVKNATQVLDTKIVGSPTDQFVTIGIEEIAGDTTPYADHSLASTSDVNINYIERQLYKFQTGIQYGADEVAKAGAAKIDLISRKQKAAAEIIQRAHNKFHLYGVEGLKNYGLLNDPNLAEPIAPAPVQISGSSKTQWQDKMSDTVQGAQWIANDIVKLFTELSANNGGYVDSNTPMVLAISNKMCPLLSVVSNFGQTPLGILKSMYPNLSVVTLPELSMKEGERVYLVAKTLNSEMSGYMGVGEYMGMSPVIQYHTSCDQKMWGSTWGAIITRPSCIAMMSGI